MNNSFKAEMPRDDKTSKHFLNFPDLVGALSSKGELRSASADRAFGEAG